MLSNRKSIEKARMDAAFENSKIEGKKPAKEFESSVNIIPAFIHINGVGNTFAFLAANQNKSQWKNVITAIYNWLENSNSGFKSKIDERVQGSNAEKLLELAKSRNNIEYRALMIELLAYFNWLRKFAKANKIKVEEAAKKQKEERHG